MERERFIELVTGEQEHLRRFLLAQCLGDRESAEEIAQIALIKAYMSLDKFREQCSFRTWLFKIAYNAFLDSRKDVRRKHLPPSECIRADEEADTGFRYESLYKALEKISEKERSVILLHYIGGYSVKEIAVICQSTESAIKVRLSRAREELRRILKYD